MQGSKPGGRRPSGTATSRRWRWRHGTCATMGSADRGASSPFLFCCLLIDRVAAVRSVDFAAEEGVVAPPGGAPGTPAGCCWLLDVSLRRMARSGWTCDLGDGHDDLRDDNDSRSRSYVPFLPLSFLFSHAWSRRTASQRRCRRRNVPGVGWGRSLSALALESQRAALAHHLRRRSICGGEARDGWVGQQINVRRGRVIPLPHVGKLQQVRLTRGLPHDLRLAAPLPGDRRSRRRGSLSGTTLRSLQLHRRTGRLAA